MRDGTNKIAQTNRSGEMPCTVASRKSLLLRCASKLAGSCPIVQALAGATIGRINASFSTNLATRTGTRTVSAQYFIAPTTNSTHGAAQQRSEITSQVKVKSQQSTPGWQGLPSGAQLFAMSAHTPDGEQ